MIILKLSAGIAVYAQGIDNENDGSPENEALESELTAFSDKAPARFFIAPAAEAAYYGREAPAVGGGIVLGYGSGTALGIQCIYAQTLWDAKQLTVLELTGFFRFYPNLKTDKGLYLQINAGLALFSLDEPLSFPAKGGSFSAGLTAGWRFLLGEHFYIEPYLRAGYPYYGGAGLSLGVRL